jgi:hypothetical protein
VTFLRQREASPASSPPATERVGVTRRGWLLALAMVVLMVGMTQAMNIRAQAADVGGSSPPVAPTYLLFLWALLVGAVPAHWRSRLRLSRQDVLLAYCAAMISGPIAHQYAIGFLVPHMVSAHYFFVEPYYYATGDDFHQWLPGWFGPSDPDVVRGFFLGTNGRVPWSAWLLPGVAWTVLLAALFLVGHCALILVRQQWIDNERLSFPLAQIPLGLTAAGADGWAPVLRVPVFWTGLALPMLLETLRGLHRYYPGVPDIPLRPMLEFDFAARGTPPWTGMGLLEFHLVPWLIAIVALLPAEISFSGWVFFWITKAEDVSALVFGATDLPSVYSNQYPALYAQGAGAAYALAALVLWTSRRHLLRLLREASGVRRWALGQPTPTPSAQHPTPSGDFASPRFAVHGLLLRLTVMIGWLWLAGMRLWVAGLLVTLMLGYFLIFARIRGEAGLSMGVILWPKMLDEVMITIAGTRGLLPADLTVLYGVRWLYFGPAAGGVIACQLESFKIAGEAGLRHRSTGGLLLLAALLTVPLAFAWTLHTYYSHGFSQMPIGHRERSMVGSQIYWSYFNVVDAMKNPTFTDWSGITAMGTGAGITFTLAALRARFLWWPLHPIGYMAANSWGMHWNWGSFTLGWLLKVVLLRYGGLRAFRAAVPFFIGLVVGDMLAEGFWGAVAAWIALAPE